MLSSALFAFLHFAAIFGIAGALFVESLTLTPTPTLEAARRIQACDRLYGLSAAAVLVVGALRVAYFEKGWAYYSSNPFFFGKMALFLAMGLLSIYPTVRFIKWSAQTKQGKAPTLPEREYRLLRLSLRLQLMLLFGIALAASLMARAVGM
jgi:putative membrane protein